MTTVAVLGATGRQGGAVVDALLADTGRDKSLRIRALTRRPDSRSALRLVDRGVEIQHADMNDEESLVEAFASANIVFSVQDYWADGIQFDGEIQQATNVIAAAQTADVSHLIQSTMATAENVEGVAHFASKRRVEALVQQSGLPHTFVGTVFFLENALDPRMGGSMLFPTLAGTLAADTRMHLMSCADIGPVVSSIVPCPADHDGLRIDIAGDFLTVS